jgi:RNA polymerase sigma-70 factor (ECF subfamily)
MPSNDCVQTLYSDHHGWLHAWLRSKLSNAADAATSPGHLRTLATAP